MRSRTSAALPLVGRTEAGEPSGVVMPVLVMPPHGVGAGDSRPERGGVVEGAELGEEGGGEAKGRETAPVAWQKTGSERGAGAGFREASWE